MRQLPNVTDSILRRQRVEASVSGQSPEESSSEEDDQTGDGLDRLREAMNLAELGDHTSAWDALYLACQAKLPRHRMKEADGYCAQLRDNADD